MPKFTYQGSLDTPKTVAALQPIAVDFAHKMATDFIPSLKLSTHTSDFIDKPDRVLFTSLVEPNELQRILKATPHEMRTDIIPLYSHFTSDAKRKILDLLKYREFRSKSAMSFWFADKFGVKTCMHCNTSFTLAIDDDDATEDRKVVFQFDHYYPKKDFPYLSLSFFNLIPSCGSCNLLLSTDEKHHHPLEVSLDDLFAVSVDPFDLVGCIANPTVLPKITTSSKDTKYTPVFDKLRLSDRYAHFADFAQEIIWKNQVYTDDYKQSLSNLLGKPDLVNRALWGNYCTPDAYHKRPLSKFCTDICRQLGVL
jgi:hypothetical protein